MTWDETRVIEGAPARYILIARRRGADWYVGALTNEDARDLDLPLTFLGGGASTAEIYSDAPDAATQPKNTLRKQRTVDARTILKLTLAPGGGAALRLTPLKEAAH